MRLEIHRSRHLPAIKQEVTHSAIFGDVSVHISINKRMKHPEKADQVALPRSIGTNEQVERLQFEVLQCADGFESSDGEFIE